MTFFLSVFQSFGISVYIFNQPNFVDFDLKILFYFLSVLSITTGSMFLMWFGEQITERGIGNGASLLIFSGIISNLPFEIHTIILESGNGFWSYLYFSFLFSLFFFVILFIVFIERAQRHIVVNYAKRQQGRKIYAPQSSHLPLKINMAGVIPPIFASSILVMPGMFYDFFSFVPMFYWLGYIGNILKPGGFLYSFCFFLLIVFFCFFYTSLVFNSKEIADNLKKSGAFISGVRPGKQTSHYINIIMNRLTFIGSVYVSIICLIPVFIMNVFEYEILPTIGGTSLLIIVVVIMDFMSQMQSYLMSTQYDSLLKKTSLIR